jgi:ParB-like chromosome segregation protein Spo0J
VKVPISKVVFEKSVYPRVVDKKGLPFWAIAHKYALAMKAGSVFPPIALAEIRGRFILVDGWHRVLAAKELELDEVEAEFVGCKTYDEVYIEALRRNTVHGAALSPYEVAIAIKSLREKGYSYSEIAEIVHVPKETAQKWLKERVNDEGVVAKKMVAPVKIHVTDENQRTLAAKSQLSLINELVTLIREDLIDWEDKDVVKALNELGQLMAKIMHIA